MVSFWRLILCALPLAFLLGCGASNAKLVVETNKSSLPEDTPVAFIFAPEIPIIPETSELVATMETNMSTQCTSDQIVPFLERRARELGANLVFVKSVQNKVLVQTHYMGAVVMTTTKNCQEFIVDFLADFPGGKNEN